MMLAKLKDKYNSLPLPVKAAAFFVLCGVFKDAIDILVTPLFTRILTTEEYGLFNVYNSWYQIFRIVATISLWGDSFEVGLARFDDKRNQFVSSLQGLMTVLFFFWAAVYFIFRQQIEQLMGLSSILMVCLLLQIMFSVPYMFWYKKNKYEYKYKLITVFTVIYTILQPFLSLLFIKLNSFGWDNGEIRIIASVGVQIVFGFIVFIIQFIKTPVFYQKKFWKFALLTNIPLVPHFLSQILLNQSDKIMIDMFVGKTETAVYSVAHSAAFVILVVATNLNSAFIPWLYTKIKKEKFDGIKNTVNIIVLFVGVAVTMLVLVAPEAMLILGGKKYYEGIWTIPSLAFSVLLILIYTLFANIELYFSKNVFVMISSLIGAASNILLNWLLIPQFGYVAAGYTTAIGYLLMCITHYIFLRLTCKQEGLRMSDFFDIRMILLISLALAGVCTLIAFVYHLIIVRYLVFAVVAAVLIIKRKKIIGFYKSMKNKNEEKQAS